MKLDSAALSELMLEVAASLNGEKLFKRRHLMDATETEVRRLGLWTAEDDILSGSVGIKSRGLAAIDFRFSDLGRTGSLVSEARDAWRIATMELARFRAKAVPSSSDTRSSEYPVLSVPTPFTALRPQSKSLVYDLVTEAGVDTSDWKNYGRPDQPATNPRYCYDWAFWDESQKLVVLCLWYTQMESDGGEIFQQLNYRKVGLENAGIRVRRAQLMDRALQMASRDKLTVRVIVVDGVSRGEDDAEASRVARRMLDPVPWHVGTYDLEAGECRLVRDAARVLDQPTPSIMWTSSSKFETRRLARIAYNSAGWQRPTGDAGELESGETYNAKNKFGHEDWLFRAEWVIDGWRYAFIQGLNKNRSAYIGQPLDVSLYTLLPDKRRRLVATIKHRIWGQAGLAPLLRTVIPGISLVGIQR